MNVHFLLCDLCLAKYQSLRFDASAILTLSYEPFNCIIWLDEHPTGPPLSSFDGDEYTEENYHDLQGLSIFDLAFVGCSRRAMVSGKGSG